MNPQGQWVQGMLTGEAQYYIGQPGSPISMQGTLGHHNHSTGNQVRRQRNQAGRLQRGGIAGRRVRRARAAFQRGGECRGCR